MRVTHEPCACGRTHGRVWPLGRKGDEVVVDGKSVLPGDVWAAVETVDETAAGLFQLVRSQREMPSLKVRVGYATEGPKGLADLRTRVTDAIGAAVGVVPDVELVENSVLLRQGPPHKIPQRHEELRAGHGEGSGMGVAFPQTVFEPAPRVWGVGRVVVGSEVTPWPVGRADIEDEAAAMAPRLAALGLGDGGLILIVSLLSQAIHVAPFEQAAGLVGARFSSADATPFDAFRTASLDPTAPPRRRARRRRRGARRPRRTGPRPRRGVRARRRGGRGRRGSRRPVACRRPRHRAGG